LEVVFPSTDDLDVFGGWSGRDARHAGAIEYSRGRSSRKGRDPPTASAAPAHRVADLRALAHDRTSADDGAAHAGAAPDAAAVGQLRPKLPSPAAAHRWCRGPASSGHADSLGKEVREK
jgi:hypothetical protein